MYIYRCFKNEFNKHKKYQMNLNRYIRTDMINLHVPRPEDPPDNPDLNIAKFRQRQKEDLLRTFVDMLEAGGKVLRKKKLALEFINRERQMSTGFQNGLAIPHVRSRYIKDLAIGFARCEAGFDFNSMDGNLTHIFFIIASPSHFGDIHIKIYKQIAMMFNSDQAFEELMAAQDPGEIIRFLRRFD